MGTGVYTHIIKDTIQEYLLKHMKLGTIIQNIFFQNDVFLVIKLKNSFSKNHWFFNLTHISSNLIHENTMKLQLIHLNIKYTS